MSAKKGWVRAFAAIFAANLAFFFAYGAAAWLLTSLKATPYGRFVAEFFKGRSREEANAYIEANRAAFEEMMRDATAFSNLFMTPAVGLVMGFVAGIVIWRGKRAGAVWALFAAIPPALLFMARPGGNVAYLFLLLAAAALGGLAGGAVSAKYMSGESNG